MAKIVPLFSGSKGNSYYVGSGSSGILIDAGRSCKQLETALCDNDLDSKKIQAVFITHEHSDHCTALKVFASRYKIPVYASAGTLEMLLKTGRLDKRISTYVIEDSVCVGDMKIIRTDTPHDAAESCCYSVCTSDGRRALIATDIGRMTDKIRSAAAESDAVVIESNHDVNMLKTGLYPYELKRRIMSATGHLSNEACSDELPDFIAQNTNRFILAHLSRENNTPELALQTALCALEMKKMRRNIDFTISVAPEVTNGERLVF